MTTLTMDSDSTVTVVTHRFNFELLESEGTVITNTPTQFIVGFAGTGMIFDGVGFGGFDGLGWPTTGTIHSMTATLAGDTIYILDDMSLSVPVFRLLMESADSKGTGDAIFGGDDQLTSAKANDTLFGWGGDDFLNGAVGDDYLNGGFGQDTLVGGKGKDRFAFLNAADTTVLAPDLISHLRNNDKIDLKNIDADRTDDGDQAFTLVQFFTDTPGELTVIYDAGDNVTVVSGDTDGDGEANFMFEIAGNYETFSRWLL